MPDDRSRGSELCTQCGLCCSGALHNAAVLDADEVEAARAQGLPVLDREKPGFALPCPRLQGTVCTIYDRRPRVCARYKCQLLLDVEAGATNFDDAVTKVHTARELVRRAHELMPQGMTLPQARVLNEDEPAAESGAPRLAGHMPLRLAITTLSLYLDKNFRNSREGKMLSFEPIADQQPNPEMT